jgi:hypothetical protein
MFLFHFPMTSDLLLLLLLFHLFFVFYNSKYPGQFTRTMTNLQIH